MIQLVQICHQLNHTKLQANFVIKYLTAYQKGRQHIVDNRHIRNSTVDFLVFTKDAKEDGIEVRVQDKDVWLTQKAIGQLFDVDMCMKGIALAGCRFKAETDFQCGPTRRYFKSDEILISAFGLIGPKNRFLPACKTQTLYRQSAYVTSGEIFAFLSVSWIKPVFFQFFVILRGLINIPCNKLET